MLALKSLIRLLPRLSKTQAYYLNFTDVVVSPPFVYIDQVKNSLTDKIDIAAQNSWIGKGGAFTGEIRYAFSSISCYPFA